MPAIGTTIAAQTIAARDAEGATRNTGETVRLITSDFFISRLKSKNG